MEVTAPIARTPPRITGICRGTLRWYCGRPWKRTARMREPVRVMPKHTVREPEADPHLNEEWLVTNGLGGYASGTVSGAITRRYHGLLIAALANPRGRMMVCNALSERLR